jgi:hypothetical protein
MAPKRPFVVPTLTPAEREQLEALIERTSEQPPIVAAALPALEKRGLVWYEGSIGWSGYALSLAARVALGRKLTAHEKKWLRAAGVRA